MLRELDKRLSKALEQAKQFTNVLCDPNYHLCFLTKDEIEQYKTVTCRTCGVEITFIESPISMRGFFDPKNRFWFDGFIKALNDDDQKRIVDIIIAWIRKVEGEEE